MALLELTRVQANKWRGQGCARILCCFVGGFLENVMFESVRSGCHSDTVVSTHVPN